MLRKISELCKERKISIHKLEKACEIGNGTISRWESSAPTVANLKKVADYLGVSIEELMK